MKILGLIPARGGSKGVPGKNTRPLAGASLIERAYRCGCDSGVLDRILLSTDDPEAVDIAQKIGLDAPFLRPASISGDTTPMMDVALHALDFLEAAGEHYDVLVLMQPTSPLRRPEHIRNAVERLGDYDAVCTVVPLPRDLCPHYVMQITPDGFLDHFMPDGARYTRRQDVPLAYRREGTLFVTRVSVLREARSFYGKRCMPLELDPEESLNIDSPEEWAEAEAILSRGNR
ncbi:MAG: acylneuraminate cytidylyltransferase family protein [Kiritimatiellae bacterium]|jgi:CMP-N,N'-diacetyllegionaminic acid synthase|nr:acylneuraminate cytidylyltransferase family protein [Kiritimatiellia bacterium]